MPFDELKQTANAMVAPGKGILAADESTGTIKKRFDAIATESTEQTRRTYREMLLTATGAADHISGVILFDETLHQKTSDGVPFPDYLKKHGIIPGIKVDKGAKPLAGHSGETVTEGLDGLRDRLNAYYSLGARFTKWRAVIDIDESRDIPSAFCLKANAHALARYAALSQEAGLVPIVEPEVLMDGAHSIEVCEQVTSAALTEVFYQLAAHKVVLEGICLKPNMVISGKKCPAQASAEEIAAATVRCLSRYVPSAVPGIAFLSGGQSAEEATENLNAMNAMGSHPWQLSFSYGRALQAPALQAWRGSAANLQAGQKAFLKRARLNGLARTGNYGRSMEAEAA